MLYLHSTNEIRVCVNDFLHFLCSLKLRIVLAKKTLGDFFLHPQYPTHNIPDAHQKYWSSKQTKSTWEASINSPTSKTSDFHFLTSLTLKISSLIVYEMFLND